MSDHLLYEQIGSVAKITFNRPDSLNAFKIAMFQELRTLLERIAADDSLRVVVLTGAGRAFSAGIDLDEQSHLFEDHIRLKPAQENLTLMQSVTQHMVDLPLPIIAAINGVAVGVGAELAIASDIRLASESAYFMFAEVKRGIFETNGVMYFLPRLVGYGRAVEWMLTGDRISAEDALNAGLVTHVKADTELLPFALQMAQTIAENAPIPVRLVKQVARRSYDLDLAAVMQLEIAGTLECVISEDFKEGVHAFVEKRSPNYKGR